MERLQFKKNIEAPVDEVYDFMLGITNKSTFGEWTSVFNPTSTYEGTWDKGSKILFIGTDDKGERGGMVSTIAENILNRYVSIHHYGILKADRELTKGPEVDKWANGYENYTFEGDNETTTLTVDLDASEEFSGYMNETYPKALDRLKELCENQ